MPAFALETPTFSGPLEALLSLIESRKLSVSDVSLSEVADAYLSYVEKLPELPLGETAQFILIASTLLLIKSRTLLPTMELSEEESANIEELERRLRRYAIFRNAAKLLKREWGRKPLSLALRAPAKEQAFAPGEATIGALFSSLTRLVATLPTLRARPEVSVAPAIALEDVVLSLRKRVTSAFRLRWSEIARSAGKEEAIVYFLALLELVRSGTASVSQEKLFGDIVLESEVVGAPSYA